MPFPAFLRQGWSSLKFSLKSKIVKKENKKLLNIGFKVPEVEWETTGRYVRPPASNENLVSTERTAGQVNVVLQRNRPHRVFEVFDRFFFFWGKGDTSASFHTFGNCSSLKEELKMFLIGVTKSLAYSFRSQFGMSSGPYAFPGFSWPSASYTLASDSSRDSASLCSRGIDWRGSARRYSSRGCRKAPSCQVQVHS